MRKKHTSLIKYVKCTPFGKMLDNIINGDLASLSSVLNVSNSFIIHVQKGHKPVPEYWFSTIQEAYNLSNSTMNELRHAAEISKPVLKIKMYEQNLNDEQRELSLIFADKIGNISGDTINEIKRLLIKEEEYMNTIIEFDSDRKIIIGVGGGIPKVFIPVKVGSFEDPYLCFRYADFIKNNRKLYMEDHLYFFNGDVHVGQISEGNQVAAYENILAAHIDIWMYLDLATRVIEADREHPIIIKKL